MNSSTRDIAFALGLTLTLGLSHELRADINVPVNVPTGESSTQVKPPETAPVKPVSKNEIRKYKAEAAASKKSQDCQPENGSKLSAKLAKSGCSDKVEANGAQPTAPVQNPQTPINPGSGSSPVGGL